jgi:hypothetical protein
MPVSPLESESKADKPINDAVEALLHDAETIYTEGAHIVARKPRTEIESLAIDKMQSLHDFGESFHIKECHFQNVYFALAAREGSEKTQWTLIRIGQFDNFIFHAVMDALSCSNTEAQFDLKLSRELLDHAWMEFKGSLEEREWDPADLNGPETHERCAGLPRGHSSDQLTGMVQDQIQRYRKNPSPSP